MGDFYLDLRPEPKRRISSQRASSGLKWYPETSVYSFNHDSYTLIIGRTETNDTWSPAIREYEDGRLIVAIAGRVALEETEWELGRLSSAQGGIVCRALAELYIRKGLASLEMLNGNFCVVVIDEPKGTCYLLNDQSGLQIGYSGTKSATSQVLCSHPDVLADALGETDQLDATSLAEFVATGRITFPYTYYKHINALPWGRCFSYFHYEQTWHSKEPRRYFAVDRQFDDGTSTDELSLRLATAFRHAVSLRSMAELGQTAVAMSGGMDSRAVLSSANRKDHIRGFVLTDEKNAESSSALAVARACGVRCDVIRRPFDYYATAAAQGARIGGGMGGLASNHFLGMRSWLREHGISNLLTGCYCDYLFKALALNTVESGFLRREHIAPVSLEFYRPIFQCATRLEAAVKNRLHQQLPATLALVPSNDELFEIECSRTFPLAYEGDCAQRAIGQRVLPWSAPIIDRGLLQVFQQVPSRAKLNGELFRGMLRINCSSSVLDIPNSNTGASILAGKWEQAFYRYKSALLNRLNRQRPRGMATRGSWPNWEYYIRHSPLIHQQWHPNKASTDVLHEIAAGSLLERAIDTFTGKEVELFQRLWTLKMWLENRVGVAPSHNSGASD